ncbi:MAG: class II glutamine amidotransferase [Thiotrichales bacterium]
MGRIAAYLGPDISLSAFALKPAHSLYHQAWESHELGYGRFNADGYGFGWFNAGTPRSYIYPHPIWHDPNLPALAESMASPVWLAAVHGIPHESQLNSTNPQPFCGDQVLFLHEGYVENFGVTLKPSCLQYLTPQLVGELAGNSDSEYLFALVRQRMREKDKPDAAEALANVLATLEVTLRDVPSLLNIVIFDGSRLIAARHATNQPAEPLYYTNQHPLFPDAQVLASEPLDQDGEWEVVPEHHLVILHHQKAAEVIRL